MEQENASQRGLSWIVNLIIVCGLVVVGFIVFQRAEFEPENPAVAENLSTAVRPTKAPTATPGAIQSPAATTFLIEEPTPTAVPSQPCRPPNGWILVTFQSGERLGNILDEYSLNMDELLVGNCLTEETISSVDKLFLPAPTPTIQPTAFIGSLQFNPPDSPVLGSMWRRPADDMVMLYVPGGTFMMGSDPDVDNFAIDDEIPQHPVTLDNYWIDRTEVTNEQYRRCVDDGYSCLPAQYATHWEYKNPDFPVVGVDWFDAQNYCTWAGGQLPTEAQWEYAARGNDGRIYPWGNDDPSCLLDNVNHCGTGIAEVTTLPEAGKSWVGALGLAGNISEWVMDWYDAEYYLTSPEINPTGPESGKKKIIRGGNAGANQMTARSSMRLYLYPETRHVSHGFRCIVPVE